MVTNAILCINTIIMCMNYFFLEEQILMGQPRHQSNFKKIEFLLLLLIAKRCAEGRYLSMSVILKLWTGVEPPTQEKRVGIENSSTEFFDEIIIYHVSNIKFHFLLNLYSFLNISGFTCIFYWYRLRPGLYPV